MKTAFRFICILSVITATCLVLSSFEGSSLKGKNAVHFPYKQAGLTDEQAAAHLLSRFTYGATPGQVKEVAAMGVENWFRQQLNANANDDSLNTLLSSYETLKPTSLINTPGTRNCCAWP
jgi:hypothetical protein